MQRAYRPSPDRAHKTPVSVYLHDRLREPLRSLIPDDDGYEGFFDRFEYLAALIQSHHTGDNFHASWFHVGRFGWRNRRYGGGLPVTVDEELEREGVDWPLLAAGEFNGDLARLREVKADVDQRSSQAAR